MQRPNQVSAGVFQTTQGQLSSGNPKASPGKTPWWKPNGQPTRVPGWISFLAISLSLILFVGPALMLAGAPCENKVNLDAEVLSKFAADLELAAMRETKKLAELPRHYESFQHMILTLFRNGIIQLDSLKRLAGASGSAGTDADYAELKQSNETNFPDDKMCILTGPKNLGVLLNMLKERDEESNQLLFTYHLPMLLDKRDIGIVVMKAHSGSARVIQMEDWDAEFGEALTENPYGKGVFRYVAPN